MSRKIPSASRRAAEGKTPDRQPGKDNEDSRAGGSSSTIPAQEQDVHALVLAFCYMVREGATPRFGEFRKIWEARVFSHIFEAPGYASAPEKFTQSLFAAALDALTTSLPPPCPLDSRAASDALSGPPVPARAPTPLADALRSSAPAPACAPAPLTDAVGSAQGVSTAEPPPPSLHVPRPESSLDARSPVSGLRPFPPHASSVPETSLGFRTDHARLQGVLDAASKRPPAGPGVSDGAARVDKDLKGGEEGSGSAMHLGGQVPAAGRDPAGDTDRPSSEAEGSVAHACTGAVAVPSHADASAPVEGGLEFLASPRRYGLAPLGLGLKGMRAGDNGPSSPSVLFRDNPSLDLSELVGLRGASQECSLNASLLGLDSPPHEPQTSEPPVLQGRTSSWGDATSRPPQALTAPLPLLQIPPQPVGPHVIDSRGHASEGQGAQGLHMAIPSNAPSGVGGEGEGDSPAHDYLADLLASDADEDFDADDFAAEGSEFTRKLRKLSGLLSPVKMPRGVAQSGLAASGDIGPPAPVPRPADYTTCNLTLDEVPGAERWDLSAHRVGTQSSTDDVERTGRIPGSGGVVHESGRAGGAPALPEEQMGREGRSTNDAALSEGGIPRDRPPEGRRETFCEGFLPGPTHSGPQGVPGVSGGGLPPGPMHSGEQQEACTSGEGRLPASPRSGEQRMGTPQDGAGEALHQMGAEGGHVPLVQQVAALYALYALYRLQPGPQYSRVYTPLRALEELTRVAGRAHTAGISDVRPILHWLVADNAFVIGAATRPLSWGPHAGAGIRGTFTRAAAFDASDRQAVAAEVKAHFRSIPLQLAPLSHQQLLFDSYARKRRRIWKDMGTVEPEGVADLGFGKRLATMVAKLEDITSAALEGKSGISKDGRARAPSHDDLADELEKELRSGMEEAEGEETQGEGAEMAEEAEDDWGELEDALSLDEEEDEDLALNGLPAGAAQVLRKEMNERKERERRLSQWLKAQRKSLAKQKHSPQAPTNAASSAPRNLPPAHAQDGGDMPSLPLHEQPPGYGEQAGVPGPPLEEQPPGDGEEPGAVPVKRGAKANTEPAEARGGESNPRPVTRAPQRNAGKKEGRERDPVGTGHKKRKCGNGWEVGRARESDSTGEEAQRGAEVENGNAVEVCRPGKAAPTGKGLKARQGEKASEGWNGRKGGHNRKRGQGGNRPEGGEDAEEVPQVPEQSAGPSLVSLDTVPARQSSMAPPPHRRAKTGAKTGATDARGVEPRTLVGPPDAPATPAVPQDAASEPRAGQATSVSGVPRTSANPSSLPGAETLATQPPARNTYSAATPVPCRKGGTTASKMGKLKAAHLRARTHPPLPPPFKALPASDPAAPCRSVGSLHQKRTLDANGATSANSQCKSVSSLRKGTLDVRGPMSANSQAKSVGSLRKRTLDATGGASAGAQGKKPRVSGVTAQAGSTGDDQAPDGKVPCSAPAVAPTPHSSEKAPRRLTKSQMLEGNTPDAAVQNSHASQSAELSALHRENGARGNGGDGLPQRLAASSGENGRLGESGAPATQREARVEGNVAGKESEQEVDTERMLHELDAILEDFDAIL